MTFPKHNTKAMTAFYGEAGGAACTSGRVLLPFAFVIAWDTSKKISRFSCHEKLVDEFTAIWAEAAKHYGEKEFRRLRLDQYGGCFEYRPMRGGDRLSTHAWGVAYDVDPAKNQLKWGRDRATLAKADYEPFWKIVEAKGAVSLGREQNRDWMHFQFATLV